MEAFGLTLTGDLTARLVRRASEDRLSLATLRNGQRFVLERVDQMFCVTWCWEITSTIEYLTRGSGELACISACCV